MISAAERSNLQHGELPALFCSAPVKIRPLPTQNAGRGRSSFSLPLREPYQGLFAMSNNVSESGVIVIPKKLHCKNCELWYSGSFRFRNHFFAVFTGNPTRLD